MSKQALRNRRTQPTRRDIRRELAAKELEQEFRGPIGQWADYLIETGRIYQ